MSKPIVRVVVAVLICLAVVAAISPSVQAKLESVFRKAEANTAASASESMGNQSLEEGTLNEQVPSPSQLNEFAPSGSSHDCNSDPTADY